MHSVDYSGIIGHIYCTDPGNLFNIWNTTCELQYLTKVYLNYIDPKWKLYVVFKSIYSDDKLSFRVNFFGHRIFNALTKSLKK